MVLLAFDCGEWESELGDAIRLGKIGGSVLMFNRFFDWWSILNRSSVVSRDPVELLIEEYEARPGDTGA